MKIKEAEFKKEMKVGLPNFSNITVSFGMTIEIEEGEKLDTDKCWDYVNQELGIQAGHIEPSWMETREYSNFFKTTIKSPKNKGGEN